MLDGMRRRAEAEGTGELDFIVGLVRPVPAHPFAGPELDGGVGVFSGQLGHVVGDAVFVDVGRLVKAALGLGLEAEGDAGVHDGLAVQDVFEILVGVGGLGEDL